MANKEYNITFGGSGAGSLMFAIEVYKKILPELLKIQSEYEVQFNFHQIGDTKNAPYGLRPPEEIKELTENFIRFLGKDLKANIAIIACNTASTILSDEEINFLHQEMPELEIVPIIDDSALEIYHEAKALGSKELNIGILSTTATMKSGQYSDDLQILHRDGSIELNIYEHDPQIWVKQIENGEKIDVSVELNKVRDKLEKMDIIGLFCTHFPFIKNDIASYLKEELDRTPKILSQSSIFTNRILQKIQEDKENFVKKEGNSPETKAPAIYSNVTGDNIDKIKDIAKNVAGDELFNQMNFSKTNLNN